jgi:hypothetical protein
MVDPKSGLRAREADGFVQCLHVDDDAVVLPELSVGKTNYLVSAARVIPLVGERAAP